MKKNDVKMGEWNMKGSMYTKLLYDCYIIILSINVNFKKLWRIQVK